MVNRLDSFTDSEEPTLETVCVVEWLVTLTQGADLGNYECLGVVSLVNRLGSYTGSGRDFGNYVCRGVVSYTVKGADLGNYECCGVVSYTESKELTLVTMSVVEW